MQITKSQENFEKSKREKEQDNKWDDFAKIKLVKIILVFENFIIKKDAKIKI